MTSWFVGYPLSVAACLSVICLSQAALAQGNGTSFVIDVDPGVQLRCSKTIELNITAAEVAEALVGGGSGNQGIATTATSTSVTANGSTWEVTITGLQSALNSYRLTRDVADVCTVRALGRRNGDYLISSTVLQNAWLDGPSGSRILVSKVLTRPGFSNGAFAPQFSVPGSTIRQFQANAITVDFQLEIDLQQARAPGFHSSATPGTFIVTATAP